MLSDLRSRSLPPLRRTLVLSRQLLVRSVVGAGLLATPLLLQPAPAPAQQAGYGQTMGTTPMERQLYDGGGGRPSSGSVLDSTNPLDLMNKLRRGSAMDDATPPASAIDQALQQFESQTKPATAAPAGPQAAAAGLSAAPAQPAGAPQWNPAPAAPLTPGPSGSSSQRPAL